MNRTLTTALAALGILAMSAGAAFATAAVATADVNIRSGAGIDFAKIGTLAAGTAVEVTECQNSYCYIEQAGTDGWVSSKYLAEGAADDVADASSDVPVHFGMTVGPGGPTFSFGIGDGPLPPPAPPLTPKVCFYKNANFAGASFCATAGTNNNHLAGGWDDAISSIQLVGGAGVTVCRNWWYGGGCVSLSSDKPHLNVAWNNRISSFQAY
jgi:hypothetical protein